MQIKPICFNYKYNFNSQNHKNANYSLISFNALGSSKRKKPAHMATAEKKPAHITHAQKKPAHMAHQKTLAEKLQDAIYDYTIESCNSSLKKRAKKKQKSRHYKFKPSKTVAGTNEKLKKDFGIVTTVGFEHKDIGVLNWIYHALVNLSNATGGKFVRSIDFIDYLHLGDTTLAAVRRYKDGYCSILVNKDYYDNIDNEIDEYLKVIKDDGEILRFEDGKIEPCGMFNSKEMKEIISMIDKYKKGKLKSFEDKVILSETLIKMHFFYSELKKCPSQYLEQLGYSASDIKKIPKENLFGRLIRELDQGNVTVHIHKENPFMTIYHEVCHSRDIRRHKPVKNYKSPEDYPPILKDWFSNQSELDTAYLVSTYAKNGGPDEFIAETYSKMVAGKQLPDEVQKLYRKYHGPRVIIY